MKATEVNLYSKELDEDRLHDVEHAQRIFDYPFNHGWELKDKNFELNKDGIITKRANTKAQGAEEQGTA